MVNLYEQLMTRMSSVLKPVSSANRFEPIKQDKKTLGFRPFMTISREPGSGGKPIAKLLAKQTGFEYYGHEMVEKVAKNSRLRAELLRSIDEKSRTTMQDMVHSLFNPDYVSDVQYIKKLVDVMLSLSERGDVVLMGRGANFVTSSSRGLHVRISAPYPVRVERAVKYERISERKAHETIRKIDGDRKSFVRQYFDKDVSDANYYDLVINTTYLNIEEATHLIVKAFELKFPGYLAQFKLRQRRLQAKRK
ncbi:MAG: cytidylate kinase-like family protein [Candidatus Chisholmbacteria bacterium]|nr:cytidylate kinase-like family protein [Candidatus Chisholmbacteria bacterium]